MANMLDYLRWRGDLSFSQAPLCEVDSLVLCRAAYLPLEGAVPGDFSGALPLGAAAARVLEDAAAGKRAFRREDDAALARELLGSERFSGLGVTGFRSRFNPEREEQFAAVTFLLPDGPFVSFKGTDGTLVGWKEDFNMAFADATPGQRDAVEYLESAAAALPGDLRVAGHSKGGNLAMYASAFCGEKTRGRVAYVRNMDGPGFNEKLIASEGFSQITGRTHTYLPQSSIFGMLLGHNEDFSIVHSVESGLFQHDLYSWEVERTGFVPVGSLTNSSQFIDASLKNWLSAMDDATREKVVDSLFEVLGAANVRTIRALRSAKSRVAILKAAKEMDGEQREFMLEAIGLLRSSMKKSLPVGLGLFGEKKQRRGREPGGNRAEPNRSA